MSTLTELVARQYALQKALGALPTTRDEQLSTLRTMVLACTDELHEALAETGWKPWASSQHINADAALAELVDALQFLLNAMFAVMPLAPELLADKIQEIHERKVTINLARASNGYDGVSGKCPECHRSYDDPAVPCRPGLHMGVGVGGGVSSATAGGTVKQVGGGGYPVGPIQVIAGSNTSAAASTITWGNSDHA